MCMVCALEMSLSIFQTNMNRCHSIVEKVHCRSTTGLGLGLDVHRHLGLVIILFWNTYSTTGSYRNYIAREYGDSVVSMQLYRGFKSGGPDGACKCCFTFVSSCRNECGKPCTWMTLSGKVIHCREWNFESWTFEGLHAYARTFLLRLLLE